MAKDTFIITQRFVPVDGPYMFVGPYADKDMARYAINKAIEKGCLLVMGNKAPKDAKAALHVEIVTWTVARRKGMSSPMFGDKRKNNLVSSLEKAYKQNPVSFAEVTAPESTDGGKKRRPGRPKRTAEAITSLEFEKPRLPANPETQVTKVIIIAKSMGMVEWLSRKGISGDIISRVTHSSQIEGADVIGILPVWLAASANRLGVINMPELRPDQREDPFASADDMEKAGARIDWYKVNPA